MSEAQWVLSALLHMQLSANAPGKIVQVLGPQLHTSRDLDEVYGPRPQPGPDQDAAATDE